MNVRSTLGAGLVGTLAISAIFEGSNALLGTSIDLQPSLGGAFTLDANRKGTRPLGAALHFLMGCAVLPVGYHLAFRVLGRSGVGAGALVGTLHGLASGTALPVMESFHPARGTIPEHGLLAKEAGEVAPWVFVAGHTIYGAILGALLPKPLPHGIERVTPREVSGPAPPAAELDEGTAVPVLHSARDRELDERATENAPTRPD